MAKKIDINKRFRDNYVYKSSISYDIEQRIGETEVHYYRRLAKVADQRLVRLEAYKHDKGFSGVEKMAYGRAMEDLKIFGKGKRFNTKPPEDRRLFREKIMAMRYFLQSPTSTKEGIIETYEKRVKTINHLYFNDKEVFTWQDLENYYGKGKADIDSKNPISSDTVIRAIALIKDTSDRLVEGLRKRRSVKTAGPITDAAIEILKQNGAPEFLKMTNAQEEKVLKTLETSAKRKSRRKK